jgi:hypothetical protein
MLSKDVRIGAVYRTFVAGYPTAVRVLSPDRHGGWIATNLQTRRPVRIRTAASLGPTYLPLPPSPRVEEWID